MRGWLILTFVLLVGVVLGVGAASRGPSLVARYLPGSIRGPGQQIQGEILRKQREANRLMLKVETAQGPMLVTFTQKVPELDLLLEPGDEVTLGTTGYATFVDDPSLDRVQRPREAGPKDKTVR